MVQKLRSFYGRWWFCLLVELLREGSAPAACAAGLFRVIVYKKKWILSKLCPLLCVIQQYRFYIMSQNQYHWFCKYHKSMSIPWVFINTISLSQYHRWCQYHESMSTPWVLINFKMYLNLNKNAQKKGLNFTLSTFSATPPLASQLFWN